MGRKAEGSVPVRNVQYPEQYQSYGPIADHLRRHWQAGPKRRNACWSDRQYLPADPVGAEAFVLTNLEDSCVTHRSLSFPMTHRARRRVEAPPFKNRGTC